jgi:hypothetical protein
MIPAGSIRRRFSSPVRSESGMALPTALFALVATFALAAAAILASVDVQQGTHYDSNRKSAIAAADAGANLALLRLNRFQGSLSETNPCVGPAGESLPETAAGSGWCPATAAESLSSGGESFSYQVSAFREGSPQLSIVSVGTAGPVSRRIDVGLYSTNGQEVFADEHLIGKEKISVIGGPEIKTNIGTNGEVFVNSQGASWTICGNVRHGTGTPPPPKPDCNGEIFEGNKELPPIVPPDEIETKNSDCRLVPDCTDPTEVDIYQPQGGNGKGKGGGEEETTAASLWDPATRVLEIKNGTLTMGGSDYLVCKLVMKGGELIMSSTTRVRIFVDTPENCGYSDGVTQVEITGNAQIKSSANNTEESAVPGIYVLGSPNIQTNVVLKGTSANIENELLLYAPYSDITIEGNATWKGSIAGNTVTLNGNPTIESLPGAEDKELTTSSLWSRTRYVECTGPTASPPDANC